MLGLPDDVEPVAFTPLGYPADKPGHEKEATRCKAGFAHYVKKLRFSVVLPLY